MDDLLEKVLNKTNFPEIDFIDIRVFQKHATTISVETGRISKLINSSYGGAGVRVFSSEGCWSHASTNSVSEESLLKTLNVAYKAAKSLTNKTSNGQIKLPPIQPIKKKTVIKARVHPNDVSLEEKAKSVFEYEKIARTVDPRIVNTHFNYQDSIAKEIVINSFGSNVSSTWVYTQLKGRVTAKEMGDLRETGFSTVGKTQGFEVIEQIDAEEFSVNAARKALSKLTAKTPTAGKFKVILDPRLTGLFAHEAFGHSAEADLVMEGASVLEGMLGKQIASPNVTIIDDPTIPGSFGFFQTDSEGVIARQKELLADGILTEYLHTLETASKMNMSPNGSARASSHHVTPLARMGSIYVQPKDYSFEELIEGVTGIYMKGAEFGHVDPATGEFLFKAEQGWNVENGELKEQLRDVALSGTTLEILKNIEAVGKDLVLIGPGQCGKRGQLVPVDDGGPHIRVKDVIVGGLQ